MGTILGTLVTNVAVKVSDSSLRYFTSTEIKKAIGDSYRYYVMKLVELGQGYFETTTDLDLTGGSETVSLASLSPPFWIKSQVWRYITNGHVPLEYSEDRFVPVFTIGVGTGDAYRPRYRQRGQSIVLNPPPTASEIAALKLDYVYQPTFPDSTSSDSFAFDANFPAVYESNIEIRSAIKILESKDAIGGVSDIATFRQELEFLDAALEGTSETEEYPDKIQYLGINYNNGGY